MREPPSLRTPFVRTNPQQLAQTYRHSPDRTRATCSRFWSGEPRTGWCSVGEVRCEEEEEEEEGEEAEPNLKDQLIVERSARRIWIREMF